MKRVGWLSLLLLPILVLGKAQYPFADPQLAQRFEQLTHRFRCLVCQNEDLAASNASLAMQLKADIYQQLNAGHSDQQIRRYLVSRYGDFVLFKPPLAKRTWLLWWGPWLFLALGLVIVVWRMREKQDNDE